MVMEILPLTHCATLWKIVISSFRFILSLINRRILTLHVYVYTVHCVHFTQSCTQMDRVIQIERYVEVFIDGSWMVRSVFHSAEHKGKKYYFELVTGQNQFNVRIRFRFVRNKFMFPIIFPYYLWTVKKKMDRTCVYLQKLILRNSFRPGIFCISNQAKNSCWHNHTQCAPLLSVSNTPMCWLI